MLFILGNFYTPNVQYVGFLYYILDNIIDNCKYNWKWLLMYYALYKDKNYTLSVTWYYTLNLQMYNKNIV